MRLYYANSFHPSFNFDWVPSELVMLVQGWQAVVILLGVLSIVVSVVYLLVTKFTSTRFDDRFGWYAVFVVIIGVRAIVGAGNGVCGGACS